ncbi:MAG: TA system VapC family ribonuclease toxin [Solirubrobacteraceae bacterium]
MTAEPAADAILIDANLLLWAHHRQFAHHESARAWLAGTLSNVRTVGIPWPSVLAFVRLSTHRRVLARPLDVLTAHGVVAGWLSRDNVITPVPTQRHLVLFGDLLRQGQAAGDHSTDAHLAALAIEWGLLLMSADRDFARYPGLRWQDPSRSW